MKRKLDYENLRDVVWVSDAQMSPDGGRAAYVRAASDYRTGKNIPTVMELAVDAPVPVPVSRETKRQFKPAYSPDGRFLAFLSDDTGFNRLWLKDRSTGTEQCALRTRYGIPDFAWCPDGKSIAFVTTFFPEKPGEDMFAEMTETEYATYLDEKRNAPRVAENLIYKFDDSFGFIEQSRAAIGILDVSDLSRRVVTSPDHPCYTPSWSDDGKFIFYYTRPHAHAEEMTAEIDRLEVATGQTVRLSHAAPVMMEVPMLDGGDGKALFIGYKKYENSWQSEPFVAAESDPPEESLFPEDAECQGVGALISGDNHMGEPGPRFRKSRDGGLYFLAACDGDTNVYRLADGRAEKIYGGTGCVTGFCAPVGRRMLVLKSNYDRPRELFLADLETGAETRLTDENAWVQDHSFIRPTQLTIPAGEDDAVNGWVVMPEGTEDCACVLYVHGGPESFFAREGFLYDAQVMAAKGLAVVYCDPRGSFGYGVKHMKSGFAFGQAAVDDFMAYLDAVLARFPRIDKNRLGVTGGSYGGFMTNKLTIVTDRFRAAAAQRTFVDPATSYGTGDMGFITGSGQTDFKEYMLGRARDSVLRDIGKISAATLMLHGEVDYRCGVEQGDQVFTMLRALKPELPARLVLFPGENHNVTREGLMHNQVAHMREMSEWMLTHLAKEARENG